MRANSMKLALAMMCLGYSTQTFAIVGVQVLAGQRSSTFKTSDDSEKINATEVQTSISFDPFPMVPLAFGAYYIMHDYKVSDDGSVVALDQFKGSQIGAEALVWVPFKPTDFSLFAKAGYSFLGKYSGKNKDVDLGTGDKEEYSVDVSSTGTRFGIGLKWSPIALVSGLIQVDYAADKMKVEEVKVAGVKSAELKSAADDIDVNSYSFLLGFEVRF